MNKAIENMTDREFARFQELIHETAGIFLSTGKKLLLEARLAKHLRLLGLKSFSAYYRHVTDERNREELVHLLDRIAINETRFFREPRHFEFLKENVFPSWAAKAASGSKSRRVRAWSAGCSTGQEPYSLAMTLCDHCPSSAGWQAEIFATDLSTRALDLARAGVWPLSKQSEIPPAYLERFMLRGSGAQQGNMKVGQEIRSIIRFERLNLNDDEYPMAGFYDLIFCRNVLIYFDPQRRARVIHRLLNHLAPDGYLFLGHAESLIGVTSKVRHVIPTVYVHANHLSKLPDCGFRSREDFAS